MDYRCSSHTVFQLGIILFGGGVKIRYEILTGDVAERVEQWFVKFVKRLRYGS